jgi:hypothetical protein
MNESTGAIEQWRKLAAGCDTGHTSGQLPSGGDGCDNCTAADELVDQIEVIISLEHSPRFYTEVRSAGRGVGRPNPLRWSRDICIIQINGAQ